MLFCRPFSLSIGLIYLIELDHQLSAKAEWAACRAAGQRERKREQSVRGVKVKKQVAKKAQLSRQTSQLERPS